MKFLDLEINEKICKRYILGIFIFIVLLLMLNIWELVIPKTFNKKIDITEDEQYAVSVENLDKSKIKISISGYAFKGPDAIERYNSYYILKNIETGKMYKLKTKMEARGQFKDTGVEYSGMHSQALTVFMQKGTYDLYIWYDNNDENKLLKTDIQIDI